MDNVVLDVYDKGVILSLLKWLRNDNTANRIFNYQILKENMEVATEEDILELFTKNHHTTTKSYSVEYSILKDTEN